MLVTEEKHLGLFIGSKIGSFKHVQYCSKNKPKNGKKLIENLFDIKSLKKGDEITCMRWADDSQTEILIGRKNKQIEVYNTDLAGVTKTYTADFADGDIVGLGKYGRKRLAAVSSGVVRVWSKKKEYIVNTGGKLDKMRQCPDDPTLFATGGEENDLKIWKIGSEVPMFCAKNLPNDYLQLRQPVWVSDMAFVPGEGGNVVGVCSRHGYVRLYDTRAQRRPVCKVDFQNMAATCMSTSFEQHLFLVGFGRGQLHQVDLRAGRPDKGYKDCVGAVTDVASASVDGQRLVISTSLDRHVRVHDHTTKAVLYKQYLTSKLTALLIQTNNLKWLKSEEVEVKDEVESTAPGDGDEVKEERDELDELFDNMQTVGEKSRKRKMSLEAHEEEKLKNYLSRIRIKKKLSR